MVIILDDINDTQSHPIIMHTRSAIDARAISSNRRQTAKITKLPVEILDMIFSEVDDLRSIICLCLVHELLGAVGERHAHELILQVAGSWAGDRIMCVGANLLDHDFPPQLQSAAVAWTKEAIAANEGSDNPYPVTAADILVCKCHQSTECICLSQVTSFVFNMPYIRGGFRGFNEADRKKIDQLANRLYSIIGRERTALRKGKYVLCNLSKGEYVKTCPMEALNERLLAEHDISRGINPDHVLLSKICWSSDANCSMPICLETDRMSRGPWAGDRIEVTTEDMMRHNIDWQDVTEESFEWIERVWTTYHT